MFELFSRLQVTTSVGFNKSRQCCMKVRDGAQPMTAVCPLALWQHSSLCDLAREMWELARLETTFPIGLHYSEAGLVASVLKVEQLRRL